MKKIIQFNHFKENIISFFPKRLDLTGNITKNFQIFIRNERIKNIIIYLYNKILNKKKNFLLNSFYQLKNFKNFKKKIKFKIIGLIQILKKLKKLRNKFLENKYVNFFRTYTTRKLRKPFRKDIETGAIQYNPFFKFQLPGYPKIKAKKRFKLRKKLLIRRLRNKFKFLILQQSIALHSFIGTKDLSYANLVKTNKLNLSSVLYQYKIRKKNQEKINFKERKLIKRPFKLIRMNQARFHILEHPLYSIFYENMKMQMNNG